MQCHGYKSVLIDVTFILNNSVQIKGTKYSTGSVTVVETDIIPTFGIIVNLLVVDVDVCV